MYQFIWAATRPLAEPPEQVQILLPELSLLVYLAKRREEHISKRINETLKENEVGMLIMTDENRMRSNRSFHRPTSFLVHPPALNDVQRWLRDYLSERMKREK